MKEQLKKALALVLVVTMLSVSLVSCGEEKKDKKQDGTNGEEFKTGAQIATLVAGGCYDNKRGNDNSAVEFDGLVKQMNADGVEKADGALICGGYRYFQPTITEMKIDKTQQYEASPAEVEENIANLSASLKSGFGLSKEQLIFTQGDRDGRGEESAMAQTGSQDPQNGKWGTFVISENDYGWSGTTEEKEKANLTYAAASLEKYLNDKLDEKFSGPIFVLSHVPLADCDMIPIVGDKREDSPRTLMSVLNDASGKGLNVFYLFANSHYQEWDSYRAALSDFMTDGDTLTLPGKEKTTDYTLNFTYVNVGYTGKNTDLFDNIDSSFGAVEINIYDNCVKLQWHSVYVQLMLSKDDGEALYEAGGNRFRLVSEPKSEIGTVRLTTPVMTGSMFSEEVGIARVLGLDTADYAVSVSGNDPLVLDLQNYLGKGNWTVKTDNTDVAMVEGLKVSFCKAGNVKVTINKDKNFEYSVSFVVSKKNTTQAKAQDYLHIFAADQLLDGMHCLLSSGGVSMMATQKVSKDGMDGKDYNVYTDDIVSVPFPEMEWVLKKTDGGYLLINEEGELTASGNALSLSKNGTVFTANGTGGQFTFTAKNGKLIYDKDKKMFVLGDNTSSSITVYARIPF